MAAIAPAPGQLAFREDPWPPKASPQGRPRTGRGDSLPSCGDVEINPGPGSQVENTLPIAVDVDAMVSALCPDLGTAAPSSTSLLQLTGSGDRVSPFPSGFVVPAPARMDGHVPSMGPAPPTSVTPLAHPEPPLSPTWDEIALDDRGTILHIPRGAVEAVTRSFVSVLSRFLSEASWESFHALWAFPKAVLAPPEPRGQDPL